MCVLNVACHSYLCRCACRSDFASDDDTDELEDDDDISDREKHLLRLHMRAARAGYVPR